MLDRELGKAYARFASIVVKDLVLEYRVTNVKEIGRDYPAGWELLWLNAKREDNFHTKVR